MMTHDSVIQAPPGAGLLFFPSTSNIYDTAFIALYTYINKARYCIPVCTMVKLYPCQYPLPPRS